jgi:hypothetical protein
MMSSGEPKAAAMGAVFLNIPEPIMVPTTIAVVLNRPSLACRDAEGEFIG